MDLIKISLPGFDVNTASPEECAIHSEFDTFKVDSHADPAHFGVMEITFLNNPPNDVVTNIFKIKHNYNHRPSLLTIFDTGPNFSTGQLITGHLEMNTTDTAWIEANVTDTEFKIDVRNHAPIDFTSNNGLGTYPTVMTLRFYIFAEDGD